MDDDENVFYRLTENASRLEVLLAQSKEGGSEVFSRSQSAEFIEEGREHIIAASALCQLAAPKSSSAWEAMIPSRRNSVEPPSQTTEVPSTESVSP